MGVKWDQVKNDLLEVVFVLAKLVVVLAFIVTIPVFGPIAAAISAFQERYLTGEVNEYVKAYLGLIVLVGMIFLAGGMNKKEVNS